MSTVAKQLLQEEGSRACVYKDSEGWWTIGIGRLVDSRKNARGLSTEEQLFLLNNDLAAIRQQLDARLPWWQRLSEPRQAVLIGMCFQLGIDGLLKFKQTLRAIERGDFELAASNMLVSLWAQQTPGRAKRMSKQMRTGEWQPADGYTLP